MNNDYWLHVWNPDLTYKCSVPTNESSSVLLGSEEGTYAYSIPVERWYIYLPGDGGELNWDYPKTVPTELLAQLLLF